MRSIADALAYETRLHHGTDDVPPPAQSGERRTERALRVTYGVVLPGALRSAAASRLGFASPSYNRMTRSAEFYDALASELDDWWWRLVTQAGDVEDQQKRVERRHMEEAGIELADVVRRLLPPVRAVVEMRACGRSWRRISADMPERAYFSIRDDYQSAIAKLWGDHSEVVCRIV